MNYQARPSLKRGSEPIVKTDIPVFEPPDRIRSAVHRPVPELSQRTI